MKPNLTTPQGRYKARKAGFIVPLRLPGSLPDAIPIGARFGRYVVIGEPIRGTATRRVRTPCRCDCGQERLVATNNLLNGNSNSCGCLKSKLISARLRRHGMSKTPIYTAWHQMKRRCADKTDPWYGSRGITVCERWKVFDNFLADMGERPSPTHSVDRINPDGNYEPMNCRWATPIEQAANKRKK